MKQPSVSVVMATYNGERFLQEQLDSLTQQTLLPCELVVCDDGSTDGTLEILQNFQSNAPFEVKLWRNPQRLGYTRNFEKALLLCSGDVVFICDQDDAWFPNKIEKVVPNFDADRHVMVVINEVMIADENLRPSGICLLRQKRTEGFRDESFILGCCTAVRREWLDLVLPTPAGVGYDRWINKIASLLNVRVLLPEPLQSWRRHASNTTEFSLTRRRTVSLFESAQVSLRREVRPLLLKERDDKEFLRNWIRERLVALRVLQLERAGEMANSRIEREICTLERRISLVDMPRGLRTLAVARFLMEGGYTSFSGWRSALKDMLC